MVICVWQVKDHDGFFKPEEKEQAETATEEERVQKEKLRIVDGILKFMDNSVDLFGSYPEINCYVDAAILSVDTAYRGRGVGFKLFNGLIQLCKEKDIPFLKVFCSSSFTSRICEKLGLELVYQINYRDIPLENLTAPDIKEPHSIARVFTSDLRA